ncbi:hypothetical protein [Saprospira grandis]|uniref:Uncharacterized protein n=1 Tax=Saprospira grandis (strain Lewin) TaxID=984262 RepID=H6L015_SAPGL|nr:hypothetical protein [Saprospira grandis]AFC26022.1 hypothetical protein SGRA_3295 [Saprospira grandis str. Lewin]
MKALAIFLFHSFLLISPFNTVKMDNHQLFLAKQQQYQEDTALYEETLAQYQELYALYQELPAEDPDRPSLKAALLKTKEGLKAFKPQLKMDKANLEQLFLALKEEDIPKTDFLLEFALNAEAVTLKARKLQANIQKDQWEEKSYLKNLYAKFKEGKKLKVCRLIAADIKALVEQADNKPPSIFLEELAQIFERYDAVEKIKKYRAKSRFIESSIAPYVLSPNQLESILDQALAKDDFLTEEEKKDRSEKEEQQATEDKQQAEDFLSKINLKIDSSLWATDFVWQKAELLDSLNSLAKASQSPMAKALIEDLIAQLSACQPLLIQRMVFEDCFAQSLAKVKVDKSLKAAEKELGYTLPFYQFQEEINGLSRRVKYLGFSYGLTAWKAQIHPAIKSLEKLIASKEIPKQMDRLLLLKQLYFLAEIVGPLESAVPLAFAKAVEKLAKEIKRADLQAALLAELSQFDDKKIEELYYKEAVKHNSKNWSNLTSRAHTAFLAIDSYKDAFKQATLPPKRSFFQREQQFHIHFATAEGQIYSISIDSLLIPAAKPKPYFKAAKLSMMLTKAGDKASSKQYELPSSTPTTLSVEEKGNIITESSSFTVLISEPLAQAFSTEKQKYKEQATVVKIKEAIERDPTNGEVFNDNMKKGAGKKNPDFVIKQKKEEYLIREASEGEMDELKGQIEPGQQKQSIAHFQIDLQSLYKGLNDAGDEIMNVSLSVQQTSMFELISIQPLDKPYKDVIISKKLR